jgi:multiple sugar transport system permease protein
LILIPWVTPSVITALMWRWMYDGNNGVINDLLVRIGFLNSYFPWLANSSTALPAIMIALMWQGFPFFAIMILAGLQAIPKSLYEAAEVDGATTWQKFARITLPMLVPILFTSILLRIIWVANSMDVIYIMTGGGPGYATHTLPVYSFIRAYKGLDFGYASTIAIFLTILLIAIVAGYVIRVLRSQEALK